MASVPAAAKVLVALSALAIAVAAQQADSRSSSSSSSVQGRQQPETQQHRAIVGVLCFLLLVSFFRVYRLLWKGPHEHLVMPAAPPGSMPVECGACHSVQYVPGHGHAFLCFRCHSVNWVNIQVPGLGEETLRAAAQMRIAASQQQRPTGPLQRFAFLRRGDTLFEPAPRDEGTTPVGDVGPEMIGAGAAVEDAEQGAVEGGARRNSFSSSLPTCGICMDSSADALLLPCAHGGLCKACATKIAQNVSTGGAVCPHCRADITMVVSIDDVDGEHVSGTELRLPIARPVQPHLQMSPFGFRF